MSGSTPPVQRDPLSPHGGDARPAWRWAIDLLAALLILGVLVVAVRLSATDAQPFERAPDLVFVEIEPPEPALAVEDLPVDDEASEEDLAGDPELPIDDDTPPVIEPEPVVEPDPEPEPTPVERPPRDTPPEAANLPEGDPMPLQEDERPIHFGLEDQSFAEEGEGPVFARGDDARGGRPSTRSVDPNDGRTAVAGAQAGGTGTEPARGATRPTARPRGGRGGSGTKRATLARGVSKTVPYPRSARDRGIESTCTARIHINAEGRVDNVSSVSCDETGFGFEDALEKHIRDNFRFDPETVDGEAQATEIRWRHDFRIDN